MTFLQIIRSSVTNLPIEQTEGKSFRQELKYRLDQFMSMVENSNDLSQAVNNIEFVSADVIKKRIRIICNGIIDTVAAYYEGDINKSYNILADFMKHSNLKSYLDKDSTLHENKNLYRLRIEEGNYPLNKSELFHIPFELRGRVTTKRYSIPGLPSLYLSNSIFVAWEEMHRPGFNKIQAMRLCNTRPLRLLDLSTDIYSRNNHLSGNEDYGWQLLYKVIIWPLIAACSVKVKNRNDAFKPEYIIPQLLLQWVNKNDIDGIKYSSTNIDLNKSKHVGSFYNVVTPVKTFNEEQGYCTHLVKLFKCTQVIPMELRQFLSRSDRFDDQESISTSVNLDISTLEIVKDSSQNYSSTYFGILEHSLKFLPLENLNE